MSLHYSDRAWAESHGGVSVDTKPGRLFPTGATMTGETRMEPPSDPNAKLHAQRRFRKFRIEDARTDLEKLQPLLAERERHRERWTTYPMAHPVAWDVGLYGGERPATPEDAAERLQQIIDADTTMMRKLEARLGLKVFAQLN